MKYLGIDPAFRKSGFATCIIDEQNTAWFRTIKGGLLEFLKFIEEMPDDVIACTENSNLQDITFYTHRAPNGTLLSASQARFVRGARPLKKSELAKASRNVGANQAASEYTYQATVKRWGESRAFQVSPRDKGKTWADDRFQMVAKSEKHKLIDYRRSKDDYRAAYQVALIGIRRGYALRRKAV